MLGCTVMCIQSSCDSMVAFYLTILTLLLRVSFWRYSQLPTYFLMEAMSL